MTKRTLRYTRRMTRAAIGGFARQEEGSILMVTIAMALPLAMFVFVTYNIGVGLTTRMRAQNVADAASYTSSLWQSRFLNYCAYSRRQIVADYATIGMCTAYDSTLAMYWNIYDAQGLRCYGPFSFGWCYGDAGLVKDLMEIPYVALEALQLFSSSKYNDSNETNIFRVIRAGSDVMTGLLHYSQMAMYASVGVTTVPIMDRVVKDADRDEAAWGAGNEFTLDYTPLLGSGLGTNLVTAATALGGLKLNSLVQTVDTEAITKDEVWYYTDLFTRNTPVLGAGILPLLGRGPIPIPIAGGMTGGDPEEHCFGSPYIAMVQTWSSGLDVPDDGSKWETSESVWGIYVYTWICTEVFGNWPIPAVIYGNNTESKYTAAYKFDDAKVYTIPDNTSAGDMEPSSLAIVSAVTNRAPFFQDQQGLGQLLSPNTLLPSGAPTLGSTNLITAYSRAKAYFSGPGEDLKNNKYIKPHLHYARWGAKLAALDGNSTLNALLLVNAIANGNIVEY